METNKNTQTLARWLYTCFFLSCVIETEFPMGDLPWNLFSKYLLNVRVYSRSCKGYTRALTHVFLLSRSLQPGSGDKTGRQTDRHGLMHVLQGTKAVEHFVEWPNTGTDTRSAAGIQKKRILSYIFWEQNREREQFCWAYWALSDIVHVLHHVTQSVHGRITILPTQ